MRLYTLFIALLFTDIAYSVSVLKHSQRYGGNETIREKSQNLNHVHQIEAKSETKSKLNQGSYTFKISGANKINSLDRFPGVILDSEPISNVISETTVLLSVTSGPLESAKLDCRSTLQGKRVKTICSRLILKNGDEHSVDVLVRDGIDGASTIKPHKVWTPERDEFFKGLWSTIASVVADTSKDRRETELAEYEEISLKNKSLDAAGEVAKDLTVDSLRKSRSQAPVAIIESSTKVIIEFINGVSGV